MTDADPLLTVVQIAARARARGKGFAAPTVRAYARQGRIPPPDATSPMRWRRSVIDVVMDALPGSKPVRETRRGEPEHGKASRYVHDACRCDACRTAAVADTLARRARKWANVDPATVPHGTVRGYQYYGCRCDKCRAAKVSDARDRRARKRASFDPTKVPHGTATGYGYHGCRCAQCRAANTAAAAQRQRRSPK